MRIRSAASPRRRDRRTESWRHPVTLRLASDADETAIARLAELDSSAIPAAPRLVAVRGGAIEAAISLVTGEAIADPFRRTHELVELLRCHAGEPASPAELGADRGAAPVPAPRASGALAGAESCA